MNLFSAAFIIFIIALLVLYYTIFRKKQWVCLLLFSIAFYAYSGISNLIFMAVTGVSVFMGGIWLMRFSDQYHKIRKDKSIDRARRKEIKAAFDKKRRMILWTIIVINFGMLAVLKYLHPFFEGFLIPLGISFYMFISIGYLVDIYFEKYEAEKNPFRFLLFVSFFPQLIQGPINRYDQMKEQLYGRHTLDWYRCKRALILILFGLLKKYTIANLLVHEIANILDAPTEKTPGSAIVFAILLYSAQQYADFSGGIDIVMGVAELFGIKMMPNFRQPYFSVSLGDFWRRWHISLGAWMRDYVFYPFALTSPMQKFGKWAKKHLNVHFGRVLPASIANILVFFLVGIWHGSQWHFIFWGLYNGIVIAVSDICAPLFAKITERLHINVKSKAFYLFRIIRTFIIVNIGWYFDRIYDIRDCFLCMKNTIFNFQMSQLDEFLGPILKIMPTKAYVIVTVALCIVFADSVIKERGKDAITLLDNRPLVLRWLLYFGMIFMILESFNFAVDAGGFMYANYYGYKSDIICHSVHIDEFVAELFSCESKWSK